MRVMEDRRVNILLVDDRPENLLALEAVLDSPEYCLIQANSGIEALKWVLKKEFAVILMDVQMPTLNGFETAKMIREREKTKDVPIIFITALSQTIENILYGYSVGAIDYILKPVDPIILKCKVDAFVSMYLHKKKVIEQSELISKRTKELEAVSIELRKKEAMARAVGETSIDTIVFFNEEGEILSVNPAVTMMFGYLSTELIGARVDILFEFSIDNIPRRANVDTVGLKKDNTAFPIEVHLADAEVENEKIFVCTIRDITERKQHFDQLESLVVERTKELYKINQDLQREIEEKKATLNQLYESEEKYRLLVEKAPETIIVRKVKSDRITFINETGVELLKANSKEEIVGMSIYDIIHPSYHERAKKVYKEIEAGLPVLPYEEKFVCLNGDIIDIQVKIIPFVYGGEESLHIVIRDITEIKRNQEFIQQSEKLNVVGELAAGIAHEIRNPLTSLKGFTQLLNHQFSTESDYVEIMISEIERINTIVGELLLLAKPTEDEFKQVCLEDLLENVRMLMSAQANLHGVVINHVNQQTIHNLFFNGVENKIKQVFINIIKNAIEAMGNGGKITLETTRLDSKVLIAFHDTGAGIPAHLLNKIGNPFYTTKEKGTGLGLMISKSIIESHEGELRINSIEGKGTTVEVILPVCE